MKRLRSRAVDLTAPPSPAPAVAPAVPAPPPPAASPGIGEYIRIGFGISLGSIFALIISMAVALALFVPGFVIVVRQRKLPKEERSTGWLVFGFVLMALGVAAGLGLGFGALIGELGGVLSE